MLKFTILLGYIIHIWFFHSLSGEEHLKSIPGKPDSGDENDFAEPNDLNLDPHMADPDYDEDVLKGTSHHNNKTKDLALAEMEEIFKSADKNNDSKVFKDELITYIIENMKRLHNESTHEHFKLIDKNNDRSLSLDEYFIHNYGKPRDILMQKNLTNNFSQIENLHKKVQRETHLFKIADNNQDGSLNTQEYLTMKFPAFFPQMAHIVVHDYIEDLDTNKDGFVDKTEYINHYHLVDHKNKTEQEEAIKKNEVDFDNYDKDKNGKIDPDEFLSIMKPGYEEPARAEAEYLFKETDTNRDDFLTLAELEKRSYLWGGAYTLDEYNEHSHQIDDEL